MNISPTAQLITNAGTIDIKTAVAICIFGRNLTITTANTARHAKKTKLGINKSTILHTSVPVKLFIV